MKMDSYLKEMYDKIKQGIKLTEDELAELCYEFAVDSVEEDTGRWETYMKTIINFDGELYGIDWNRGLTESQPNSFYNQPKKVTMTEKTVVVKEYEYV
jgi:hypothetical protein